MNVNEAIDKFLEEKKLEGKSEGTLKVYASIFNKLREKFGDKEIDKVTEEEVRNLIYNYEIKGEDGTKQDGKASRHYTTIMFRSLFNRFHFDYLRTVSFDYIPKSLKVRNIKEVQVKRLMAKADPLGRLVLTLLLSSGLRSNEFLNVKVCNILFKNRTIEVEQAKGKKRGEESDIVVFSEQAEKEIKAWIVANNLQPEDYLIRDKFRDYWHFWDWFTETFGRTPHQTRHTFGTELANMGYSPAQIMCLARHKSYETSKRYIHLDRDAVVKAYREREITF